ncbi:MAG: sterol desaturase [Chitinophagales bacterium]|nr:MAG: sterol desaturase [Chitinophagales bacterium]
MQEVVRHFILDFAGEAARYLIFAGTTFSLFWIIFRRRLLHRFIQKKFPPRSRIIKEFLYSMSSIAIFSLIGVAVFIAVKNGYGQLYRDIDTYGWPYFFLSIVLAILLHDTYFYWTHRLMHHPAIFRLVHLVHHRSTNPSPWAAYAFHPFEAVIQGLIGPLIVFLMPIHVYALLAFAVYQITYNVFGHLSFELFPRGFTRSFMFWHNSTTHHNMHHKYFHCNYSLYFNWWDRLMKTLHPRYDEVFDEVTGRQPVTSGSAQHGGSEEKIERAVPLLPLTSSAAD